MRVHEEVITGNIPGNLTSSRQSRQRKMEEQTLENVEAGHPAPEKELPSEQVQKAF